MKLPSKYYSPFSRKMTGSTIIASTIIEKMNFRYFPSESLGSISEKGQGYDDEEYIPDPNIHLFHHPPPIFMIVVINIMKSSAVKNIIDPIEIMQLPISLRLAAILESVMALPGRLLSYI